VTIRTYAPALNILLTRLVKRTGGGEATPSTQPFKTVDLTPFLGTAGAVRTIKDINAPAGGFTISFADRMHPEFFDTVYALCEPNDMVEIRASRTPDKYQGTQLPLIMRGLVASVDRAEAMSADGTPERTVTIAGQDMGVLFQIHHIYFETMVLTDNDYLTTYHVQASLGIDARLAMPVNDYMHQLVEKVVNKKIDQMGVFADTQIKPFVVRASVPDGLVLGNLVATLDQINLWQAVEIFADKPFNEVFITDEESGPVFNFRPAPFRSLDDGSYIMNGASDPGTIDVDIADVVAMTMARSHARVANIFIVAPGASTLDTNAALSMAALQAGLPLDFSYPNNAPELFGTKKMEVGTNLQPQSVSSPLNMLSKDQQPKGRSDLIDWFHARAIQLKLMNRDNSQFEFGGMILKGSEDILIGRYLQLTRGSLVSTQYIESVSHHIQPLQSWTTSVHCARGDGYKVRNAWTDSPTIGEGRAGPYSP
jgi:hypothetical protein